MGTPDRLELTEDEAYSLLSLCLTSDLGLDAESERAVRKLADFCKAHRNATGDRKRSNISELIQGAG
jgi:hypothetical protein